MNELVLPNPMTKRQRRRRTQANMNRNCQIFAEMQEIQRDNAKKNLNLFSITRSAISNERYIEIREWRDENHNIYFRELA